MQILIFLKTKKTRCRLLVETWFLVVNNESVTFILQRCDPYSYQTFFARFP